MKVVITIPAYNEAKTISGVIKAIKGVMDGTKYKYSILVVDDGSKDNTADISKKAGAIVYSHPRNYGLAETFNTEMEQCLNLSADIIVHTDADSQYLASDIPKLLKEIENGYDLVLGSRFKGKIERMPWLKKLGNKIFSNIISQVSRFDISDAQTGFRAFKKKVAGDIKIISNYTYTQEQIIRAAKRKFKIKEIPIYFAERKEGKSRLMKHPIDFAIKAIINLLRIYRDYEPLKFFGFIGALFMLSGFLVGSRLIYFYFTRGVVGHIPSVILTVLLIIMGMQIFVFGFLADMHRKK